MAHDRNELKVNQEIAQLARAAEKEPIVELEGYVGPSEGGIVRLYPSFDLSHFLEIPRSSIVHVIEVRDDRGGRARVFVGVSAKITLSWITRAGNLSTDAGMRPEDEPRTLFTWKRPWELDHAMAQLFRLYFYYHDHPEIGPKLGALLKELGFAIP